MMTKITLALAVVFAVATAIPASAAPRTCGYTDFQYDSSGATVGPLLRQLSGSGCMLVHHELDPAG